MDYAKNYYKTSPENRHEEEFFEKYRSGEDVIELRKTLKELQKKMQEVQNSYSAKLQTRYNEDFTPLDTPVVLKYHMERSGNTYYFDAITGSKWEESVSGCYLVEVPTMSCTVTYLAGYVFPLASLLMREVRVNIKNDKSSASVVIKYETLFDMISHTRTTYNIDTGETASRNESYLQCDEVDGVSATDFVNGFYGLEIDNVGLSLYQYYDRCNANKSMEIIMKTVKDSSTRNALAYCNCEKPMPPHQIIGCTKNEFDELDRLGLVNKYIDFYKYINSESRYYDADKKWAAMGKTVPETIELLDKCRAWETDLRFYQINFGTSLFHTLLSHYLKIGYGTNYPYSDFYPFGKFCSYVVEESINQGFQNITTFMTTLGDYLRMCQNMEIVPTLYSSYLTQTHDITARNHKVIVTEQQEQIFKAQHKKFHPWSDAKKVYTVICPESSQDIRQEGDKLNHCVASYIKRVVDGECQILFLRLINQITENLVTLEIRNDAVVQARGLHNRAITKEEKAAIEEYAASRKIAVRV